MSLSTEVATALLSSSQKQQHTIFAGQFYFASQCHFTSSLEVESVWTFGHKFGCELWLDDTMRQRKLYLAILQKDTRKTLIILTSQFSSIYKIAIPIHKYWYSNIKLFCFLFLSSKFNFVQGTTSQKIFHKSLIHLQKGYFLLKNEAWNDNIFKIQHISLHGIAWHMAFCISWQESH